MPPPGDAPLLDWTPPDTDRQGETYIHEFDFTRLNTQQLRIYKIMKDGAWRTLREINRATIRYDKPEGEPEASISARLRDLRNMFGLKIDRRRRGEKTKGLNEYRIGKNERIHDHAGKDRVICRDPSRPPEGF